MTNRPTVANCDPLPSDTEMTFGYHHTSRCMVIMFTHPSEERGMYWPISMRDAEKMSEVILMASEFAKAHKRLDS